MDDSADAALFARLSTIERKSLVPAKGLTLSETLARSTDTRMQALSGLSADESSDVPFLLSLLSSNDPAVLEAGADALWKLAIGGAARALIHRANGSRPLVALLGNREPRVVRSAAGALSILALDAGQRTTILAAGGASALSAVLADGGDREAEQAARAAANLASDEPTRASLVDQGTCTHLAAVLRRRRSTPGLREAACRALAALATDDGSGEGNTAADGSGAAERAAAAYCEAGGTASLIDCLQPGAAAEPNGGIGHGTQGCGGHGSVAASVAAIVASASVEGAADAKGKVDDLEGHQVNIAGVAARPELNGQSGVVHSFHASSGRYHVRLESGEMVALRPACVHRVSAAALAAAMADDTNTPLAKAAVRAVRALANHRKAADELMRLGALPSLVHLLGSRAPEVAAAAATAIGALATGAVHRPTIAGSRGVAMLLRCLGEGCDRSVQEPACAALRVLCLEASVREQLAGAPSLTAVVAVLSRGDAQAREAAAGLLGSVAISPKGREAVLGAQAVQPLVKLLPLRHEPTQEAACRAIKNLAMSAEGAGEITKAGGTQPLVRLLKSGSEVLHSAASAALETLTMDATQRERLLASIPDTVGGQQLPHLR